MRLEAGKAYRAKAATGDYLTFTVLSTDRGGWATVDLDSADGPEPRVWLNTGLLLWISSEIRRSDAVSKAAAEIIETLESEDT
jgi:hypothetical protein